LNEIVLFEIQGLEEASEFCRRLAIDWLTWVQTCEGRRCVAVLLVPDEGDLAVLFRTVQRWLAEQGRGAMPFELDGRRYALHAPRPTRTSVPA
jgi:hypothetical protein